jgi:uncharacterized membrane protein YqaE (UPF0057 family)
MPHYIFFVNLFCFIYLMSELTEIFSGITKIAQAFIKLGELIFILITFIPKMIEAAFDIFNPTKLMNDMIGGTIAAISLIVSRIMDLLNPRTYFGTDPKADFGEKEDIFGKKPEKNKDGKYINPMKSKGKKCLPPTMTRMVILMLCPPFALFLHLGLSGWVSIVLCSLLTVYGYYFPGLIYAALHILC